MDTVRLALALTCGAPKMPSNLKHGMPEGVSANLVGLLGFGYVWLCFLV
jgi:hypothetical protein